MRIIIIALSLLVATSCYAEVKLYRYTDKVSGDERGVAYSEVPVSNPLWNAEAISEKDKQQYINKQKQQFDKVVSDAAKEKDRKSKKCKDKLKALGFDKDEINAILGDAYGD